MPALNRDALLAMTTLRTQTVSSPELGGEIILREMTGRDLILLQSRSKRSLDDLRSGDLMTVLDLCAWMLRYSWVNDAGDLVMGDEDVERIINMPLGSLTLLVELISGPLMELNGLTKTAVEDAKKN